MDEKFIYCCCIENNYEKIPQIYKDTGVQNTSYFTVLR